MIGNMYITNVSCNEKFTSMSFSLSVTQSTLAPSTSTTATIVPIITTGMPSGGGGVKGMFM